MIVRWFSQRYFYRGARFGDHYDFPQLVTSDYYWISVQIPDLNIGLASRVSIWSPNHENACRFHLLRSLSSGKLFSISQKFCNYQWSYFMIFAFWYHQSALADNVLWIRDNTLYIMDWDLRSKCYHQDMTENALQITRPDGNTFENHQTITK